MAQARGFKSKVLLSFESVFGSDPTPTAAFALPFQTCNLKADRPLDQSGTITGTRNLKAPVQGNISVGGDITVPLDAKALAYWLKLAFGAPSSTQHSAQDLDAGAAVDKGGGLVGLPCTGHGYVTGTPITIADTTNYNGSNTVDSTSTTDEIVITDTFAVETLAGTETVQADLYDHVFKIADDQLSGVIEKQFPDITEYCKHNGCKISRMSLSCASGGEMAITFGLEGRQETISGASYDASPTTVAEKPFYGFEAAIEEGGASMAKGTEISLDVDFGLELDNYCMGDGGKRTTIPEGMVNVSGNFRALFENSTYVDKAVAGTESSLKVTFTGTTILYHALEILVSELKYSENTPGIDGPQGVLQELPFMGYYDNSSEASAIQITLTNEVTSYS